MMAPVIFKRADTNQDGSLTLDELTLAAQALFTECDKDTSRALDEKELRAAINLMFPPPQFGPPGGRPGQPGQPGGPPNAGPPGAPGPPPAAPATPPKADQPATLKKVSDTFLLGLFPGTSPH